MITGSLAFAFFADDLCVGHAGRQCRRSEDEVDAHTLLLRKSQLGVIPIGVDPGPGSERAYHIHELRVDYGVERVAFRLRDMGAASEEFGAPDVFVGRGDIPIADERDRCGGIVAQPTGAVSRSAASQSSL